MAEDTATKSVGVGDDPPLIDDVIVKTEEVKTEEILAKLKITCDNNESGVVLESENAKVDESKTDELVENETLEVNDDARSLGDLDSLPATDELVLGAAGSDSGVEGCGRALSSGGGSRSCASSVVSCGSGCGSESSSVAGAPPRPRRRVNVTEPPKRSSPVGSSTPRPVTAPRGPNLATRERARSREKPVPPEKPRPLTPKPRIRPTTDLPNLVRESPALRAKPTKTSTARCRTPNSPSEDKRWPMNGPRLSTATDASAARMAADKYGTLPRRRRDADEGSPRQDVTPPSSRRPTVTRSTSSRSVTKTRVRIYAEKTTQTVLLNTDLEAAFAGVTLNIETRPEVSRCHRGVQVNARDTECSRLQRALSQAEATAAEERERRLLLENQLEDERAARLQAHEELQRNTHRLLELAGAAGAGAGADGCLKALEEQLRAAGVLATRQRTEIDSLKQTCDKLHVELCSSRQSALSLESRLLEAERDAVEMQDFLAAETGALSDSLRDAETELDRVNKDLEKSRAEARQLVRACESRRQEALAAQAGARGAAGATRALDALRHRVDDLTDRLCRAKGIERDLLQPTAYHNDLYSRSDSGSAPPSPSPPRGLSSAVARALRPDERSRASDDNSADLLDSETEPCLVTDPECLEEWCSVAEGGAWSGSELSPVRDADDCSDKESLRQLSAAIARRHRSEDVERDAVLERALSVDAALTDLVRALALVADRGSTDIVDVIREKIEVTEKNAADVVVKKLAELDASKNMMDQYRHSVEIIKKDGRVGEEVSMEMLDEELQTCSEADRRSRYEALDLALTALASRAPVVRAWPPLLALHHALEGLAFALVAQHV